MSDAHRVGVMVPTFRESPSEAIALALEAERLGIDGVFVYDHLWPMGRPDRPALAPFPVLGAIAARTTTLHLGALVARVGVVPDELLVAEFMALARLAPGRVIAALGTGDHLSFNENRAYGLTIGPASVRRESVRSCASSLHAAGLEVWIGGLS
ncbi:MAG TPA: LLM class flavin-dependent oxidoreductase, partial [Acidimicrobiales bacterium]|nr:LLM class flavin-dependent oxidoreductase [Acidimicrobiales bacterium]